MIEKLKNNKIIRFICFPYIITKRVYYKYINRNILHYDYLFSNVLAGSLIVAIEDIPGSFEIDARSHILQRILINKHYEPQIVSLVKKCIKADRDAINVGANIGIFTMLMADLIDNNHRILSIEPTPLAFSILTDNVKRNHASSKVVLFNGICIDTPGDYYLNTIQGKEEYSSIGESIHITTIGEKYIKIKVKGETIDNLVTNFKLDPGIILIDAEGAEMKVLTGAALILEKYKPIIVSELDDHLLVKQESSSKEVIDFLANYGYDIKAIEGNNEIKYPFVGNIIATPKL